MTTKKTIKVLDLKPSKDAKGGGSAINRTGTNHSGVNHTGTNGGGVNKTHTNSGHGHR